MKIAEGSFRGAGVGLFGLLFGVLSVGLLATRHPVLALVPCLALPVLIYLARSPEAGFYFLVGYLPFQNYTTLMMVGEYDFFTIQKFVGAWVILVLALAAIANKRPTVNLHSNLWVWFAGLWLTGFVSLLFSEYRLVSSNELRRQLVDLLYFTLSLAFLSRKDLYSRKIPVLIVTTVTASALLSIYGYVFHVDKLSLNVLQGEDFRRAQGGSHDPNYFASIIVFSMPFLVHWFHTSKRILVRALTLVLAGIGVTAIVITFSRGGFLIFAAFAVIAAFEYMRKLRPKHLGFFTFIAAAAIVFLAVFVPRSFWERQRTTFTASEIKTDYSLSRRLSYLVVGWEEFKKRPLLGAGPGTFGELYGSTTIAQVYTNEESELKRASHNSYLSALVGTGIVGLFFFMAVIVVAYRNFLRAESLFLKAGDDRMVSLTKAYKIAYLTLLITFFTLNAQNQKYFWLSLGFSQAALFLAKGWPAAAGAAAAPVPPPSVGVPRATG